MSIWVFSKLYFLFSWVKPKMGHRIDLLKSQVIRKFDHKTILIHCASAGEYEVIAALVQQVKSQYSDFTIVFSFFSPSGISWMKNKEIAADYYLLPFDNTNEIDAFIHAINPSFVIISRKELWYNFLRSLQRRSIPHFLVSSIFQPHEISLKIRFMRKIIANITRIYTVDEKSQNILHKNGITSICTGDARIDSIIYRSENQLLQTPFPSKPRNKPVIIYGSIHRSDIPVLYGIKNDKEFLHMIVPHEIHSSEINYFINSLDVDMEVFSETKDWTKNIILVNEIGLLASLYRIADYIYIGGGFDKGIHNIIEPAIYGLPIFIGPNNTKYPEAQWLLRNNGIIEINRKDTILTSIENLGELTEATAEGSSSHYKTIQNKYIQMHKNASARILQSINKELHEAS